MFLLDVGKSSRKVVANGRRRGRRHFRLSRRPPATTARDGGRGKGTAARDLG